MSEWFFQEQFPSGENTGTSLMNIGTANGEQVVLWIQVTNTEPAVDDDAPLTVTLTVSDGAEFEVSSVLEIDLYSTDTGATVSGWLLIPARSADVYNVSFTATFSSGDPGDGLFQVNISKQ